VSEDDLEARWRALRDEVGADVRRVANRLRQLSEAQLGSPPAPPTEGFPAYRSRAQAGRAAAQVLADAAAALEAAAGSGRGADTPPLPQISPFAVGDQVAVTGHDLLAAMAPVRPGTSVSTGSYRRVPASTAVADAARVLADVRRRL
jgi:hypothetical protein